TTIGQSSGGPTTTAAQASGGPTTTAAAGGGHGLPSTGFSGQMMLILGLAMLAVGVVFMLMTRRPDEA
ncbi:MAG: LPXTG cell wall anchor domain-containing protein, partial [Actinomycetota bacterium]